MTFKERKMFMNPVVKDWIFLTIAVIIGVVAIRL